MTLFNFGNYHSCVAVVIWMSALLICNFQRGSFCNLPVILNLLFLFVSLHFCPKLRGTRYLFVLNLGLITHHCNWGSLRYVDVRLFTG